MVLRRPTTLTARASARGKTSASSVYSAQVFANFCEVDLKTVHHWADRGKIPHHRTDGRHLRFRRNDVVRFLRAHGYPLPDALVRARPTVSFALSSSTLEGAPLPFEDVTRRIGSRFSVQRHPSGASALARLVADAPDAIVLAEADATLAAASMLAALKEDPATSWIVFAFVASGAADGPIDALRAAGAEIVLAPRDIAKLPGELARTLAVA